jgi:apolipoprotein N-acyltransferase
MKPSLSYPLAAASGLLLVLIHPATEFTFLAPFALAPLLLAIADQPRWRTRFLLGWLCGVLQWGGMCHWIQGTLARHGEMSGAMATALFIGFALAKGLHCAAFATLAGPVFAVRYAPPVLALLWAGLERTHGELGFTWLLLGNAASDMEVPLRLAPITGVYGLSFFFALLSAAVACWYLRQERLQLLWLIPVLGLYLLPNLPEPKAGDFSAVTQQPNLPEDKTPSDEQLHNIYSMLARRTLESALQLSQGKADLILWPEMPISLYYESDQRFREQSASLARLAAAPFLFGTVRFDQAGNPLNTAQMLTSNGDPAGTYDKMRLVPFGEYVPPVFNAFVDKVSQQAGTFQPGQSIRLFPTPAGRLGVFICYESVFADHVRNITRQGATVLVNLTNDGYFSSDAARRQHLKIARMRAAENARWLLRPTNDGLTASIDPAGRVVEVFPAEVLHTARLPFSSAYPGQFTTYTRTGDLFAWFSLAAGLGLSLFLLWRER